MSKKKAKRSAESRSLESEEELNMAVAEIGENKIEETVELKNNDVKTEVVTQMEVTNEVKSEETSTSTVSSSSVTVEVETQTTQNVNTTIVEEVKAEEKTEVAVVVDEVKESTESIVVVEEKQAETQAIQVEVIEQKEEVKQEDKNMEEEVAEKKAELDSAKQKFREAVSKSLDEELAKVENMEVISSQFNKSSDFVQNMLKRLEEHLEIAGVKGRNRVESVVDGVFGDNVVSDIATKTLGFVGEKMAQGYTLGTAPAVAVTGAVRGVYKKIVE